jgi:hypothetical protein
MVEGKNSNKIISIILAIIICFAAITILYVNLPEENSNTNEVGNDDTTEENKEQQETEEPVVILMMKYNGVENEYTLEELETMDTITGYGGYRTSYPMIKGQANYTGVPITAIVDSIAGSITNYSLFVVSNDSGLIQNQTYDYDTIQGNTNIYNSTNASDETPIGTGGLTMIVCYQKDGEYLDVAKDGDIKIAFVNEDEEKITNSGLWWKFVESIEIIED